MLSIIFLIKSLIMYFIEFININKFGYIKKRPPSIIFVLMSSISPIQGLF